MVDAGKAGEMSDVKPCPFCGDAPEWRCDDVHGMHPKGGVIRCGNRNCPVDVSVYGETPDAALDLWNKRAEPVTPMTTGDGARDKLYRQRERIATLEAIHKRDMDTIAEQRQELAKWKRLTASMEPPENPVTEFQPKDFERENAKLRELVVHMWEWLTVWIVSGAALHDISGKMHELGIEVNR